ncbi:phosphatidylglycerol lysyltransferase domain-containing protein [Actinoplanes sp. ATCC 53533]|uniref:phosphatidylglycerol lysyltransferase domain-containing protein n=1 Tax=Actinoplanes sp. ATCC 53533 TaxID=1288362 RepID=UPI001F37C456|nr:phosphatidylglycerol lysyltransferase domain-containing protein [Actinoplanes sp. ATCC 53533]
MARLVQLAGLFDVLTAVLPPRHGRLPVLLEFVPMAGILSARAATAAAGALLIYLGAGLRRGKHRAWQLAVALAGASVVLHVVKGLDIGAAVVSALLLAMLIATRGRFHAVADPRNRWRAPVALAGFAAVGFLLGFVEIAVRVNHLVGRPGWLSWAEESLLGLIGVAGPVQFQRPLGEEAVSLTTGTFGLLAIAAATILLLRPGVPAVPRTAEDDVRVRELLDRHGADDSLGYFALRPDKLLAWTSGHHAAVAHRVINGVSLATGDPIGARSAWPEAINAWLNESLRHGWTPAVLGCGNAGGTAYRRCGLDVVELGDEAVVDVADFSLEGRAMRSVRQAVARIGRAGYTCQIVRQRDVAPAELGAVVRAAAEFRDGTVERGFSMALSRIGDPRDGACLLAICRDGESRIRGVLQFVPWGPDGLSLDLMRGDRRAENGLTEFMIVSTIEAAAAAGIRRISLNFAVLRSVFARAEELGAGPVLRLWHKVLRAASRFWQIESLYRANAKYLPTWQPRYLCFPTARDLPRIALAALRAEAFLPGGASTGAAPAGAPRGVTARAAS